VWNNLRTRDGSFEALSDRTTPESNFMCRSLLRATSSLKSSQG
jgi:hypothetical protein